VLCGMRRGEITALRWRSIDLDAGQLAVVASTEQTKAGCREKDANRAKAEHLAAHPEGAGRERAILYRQSPPIWRRFHTGGCSDSE